MKRMRIQQGLAMVEFTIILPVLLILLLSILELGRAFYLYSELEKLSRDSTRYLANVIGSGTTGVYSLTDSQVANASNLIVYGTISTGNDSLLPSLTTDHVSVTFSNNYVQVEILYPFQPVLTTLPNFFSDDDISLNFTMTSSYTMRVL
ncbi:pilus assembly protein [Photobacterium profundum]|uniref:TadE/TadG family type IV pilus assembly protein n=1 Tax=Photobacterium profundum TaxID=74109 RepID=UPI003D0E0653